MSKKELNQVSDSMPAQPQSKSDQSASTSGIMPPVPTTGSSIQLAEQKSESRMKHKPHPAENVNDSSPTM